MDSKKFKAVNITVLGRKYPVKCTTEEEEQLIGAEKRLNQQLNQYRQKYEQLDTQDCLSMALIESHMDALQSVKTSVEQSYVDRIEALRKALEQEIS